ncbi:MAG: sigma-70 family RNA polymerase sigma factor [Oscillospiraceae bacterium]|nr:sigma-70 family RNA polymerase sigma factor [Oscillospiraceae bacterium]
MKDESIIELFFSRSEQALSEVQTKYGALCNRVAYAILGNREDTEECVSDSYMKLWNAIPPKRPESLCGYLCRIVRNTALNISEALSRRVHGEQFDELAEIIPDSETTESRYDSDVIAEHLNNFLAEQSQKNRVVFTARYYYNMSITDISLNTGMSSSAVKSSLLRSRNALRTYLTERGVEI